MAYIEMLAAFQFFSSRHEVVKADERPERDVAPLISAPDRSILSGGCWIRSVHGVCRANCSFEESFDQ